MVAQTVCNTGNPSGNRCSANRDRKTYRGYRCCCNAPCASLQKALQPAPDLQYSTVHRNEGDRLAQAVWRHTGSTTIQLSPPEAGSGAVPSVCSDVPLRGRDQRHFCKVPASRTRSRTLKASAVPLLSLAASQARSNVRLLTASLNLPRDFVIDLMQRLALIREPQACRVYQAPGSSWLRHLLASDTIKPSIAFAGGRSSAKWTATVQSTLMMKTMDRSSSVIGTAMRRSCRNSCQPPVAVAGKGSRLDGLPKDQPRDKERQALLLVAAHVHMAAISACGPDTPKR